MEGKFKKTRNPYMPNKLEIKFTDNEIAQLKVLIKTGNKNIAIPHMVNIYSLGCSLLNILNNPHEDFFKKKAVVKKRLL